jgi:hypothetical protein
MQKIDIRQVGDDIVLYFGCPGSRINAYTLASALVSFADAAKAANNQINPGYDIEIVVEALGNGSFKAHIRAIYRSARNLFSGDSVRNIVLGVVAAFIYEHTFAPNHDVKIEIKDDSVVIIQGEKEIIVPRNIYDATKDLKRDPEVKRSMSSFFRSIDQDGTVESVGITTKMDAPPPELQVQRDNIHEAAIACNLPDPDSRIVPEQAEIQILRAILERNKRRATYESSAQSVNRNNQKMTDRRQFGSALIWFWESIAGLTSLRHIAAWWYKIALVLILCCQTSLGQLSGPITTFNILVERRESGVDEGAAFTVGNKFIATKTAPRGWFVLQS